MCLLCACTLPFKGAGDLTQIDFLRCRLNFSIRVVDGLLKYPVAYPRFERWGTTSMASAEREPTMGSGALPPVGSRGKSPGRVVRRLRPSEADKISVIQTLILP
jgi:hypothetical protein